MTKLSAIQQSLKAPKGQYNQFGKFKYRKCEDILEAVKPFLGESTIIMSDEIVMIGDRFYVKATATFKSKDEEVSVTAFARESISKKGMDDAQVTGACSSYARKYALGGLLLTDDSKDPDTYTNNDDDIPVSLNIQKAIREKLKEVVISKTDSFKNKEKLAEICELFGITDIREIQNKSDNEVATYFDLIMAKKELKELNENEN